MKIFVRIQSVDHNGFLGRDFHPTDSMIGELVLVEKIWREDYDSDEGEDLGYYVFEGQLLDGRKVQMIDFELESNRDGLPKLLTIRGSLPRNSWLAAISRFFGRR